jgi:hypothetical protein
MWSKWMHLRDVLRLIEAWGFTYKAGALVWGKADGRADLPCLRRCQHRTHGETGVLGLRAHEAAARACLSSALRTDTHVTARKAQH